jgi:DNA-binding NarL/FixJ family response regulator
MAGEVVAREQELGSVYAFLDRPVEGPTGFVLEGEPGIGKSTLWLTGVAAARERGFLVLSSRPAEAERGLAHVVLGDLFEAVLDNVLPALVAPRRRALEAALLTDQPPGRLVDPRALGVAILTALQVLARDQPVVLAVDDEQWIDASSASALRFALRRLRDERVLLFLARRLDEQVEAPALEESIDSRAVEHLRVGPVSMGAMHLLLRRRLGRTFGRPALLRLYEVSGGNPFYGLELARGLGADAATRDPTEPFPVPESLDRLVSTRFERLGGATREALLLVAAHGRPSPALLRTAGMAPHVLEPALAARVVEFSDGVFRFRHPLLASALYQGVSREERRRAHGRLAAIVEDPVDGGRHLALASDEPDGDIAAELQDSASLARARGAVLAAAELDEHAFRLTPSDMPDDRHRRAIAAARGHLEAGDTRRARVLALDLLARVDGGAPRAEALVLISDIESAGAHLERAIELRREALPAAVTLPSLQAEIHQWLGEAVRFTEGVRSAERHARAALELAERLDDYALRAGALSLLAFVRFRAGEPDALRLAEQQAAELATATADPRQRLRASFHVVHVLVWSFQLERARILLERLQREWSERDEQTSAEALWWLSMIEFRAGRLALAADYADRSREIGQQYALDEREVPTTIWLVALIAVHRGELDRARRLAERSRALAESQPVIRAGQDAVLGLVELWTGHLSDAAALFAAAEEARRGSGVNEPAMFWWRADYVEALLALGRVDEAAGLVDAWDADAAPLGRRAVRAQVRRCRGLLAAARGDVEEALVELERAVAQHESVGDVFGRARALLALGIVRRRARQKRSAREAIEEALESFETAAAAGWAAKARLELGPIGGRTRIEGLTPAEQRVAALVAEGRTNREVAATLFLGERTVESHLSHVYAKLGVRSRAELARTFQREG